VSQTQADATNDRDHALRAVRMAMAMQARMVTLCTRWLAEGFEHPFHIRIGINTGQASIGNFGYQERMDYTAIGRQVNLAARLQTHCEPDRIPLSHSTWVLVKDAIACVPRGEIEVGGFQRPVLVYEVSEPTAKTSSSDSNGKTAPRCERVRVRQLSRSEPTRVRPTPASSRRPWALRALTLILPRVG
jgi:class 3 adenylate cyclase